MSTEQKTSVNDDKLAQFTAFKKKGNEAFLKEDYQTALEAYTNALNIKEEAIVYSNRAVTYIRLKEFDKALIDAEKTISLKPDWVKGYLRKGTALVELGKLEDANEALQKGLEIEPSNKYIKKQLEKLRMKSRYEGFKRKHYEEEEEEEDEYANAGNSPYPRRFVHFERGSDDDDDDDERYHRRRYQSSSKSDDEKNEDDDDEPRGRMAHFDRIFAMLRARHSPLKTETKREYFSKHGHKLEICSGDITEEQVDAIVNAANNNLMLGGGVAGAIARAGGDRIQQECDLWTDKYGEVPNGQCGLSSGGDMKCKYVIHAVGPVWHDGYRNEDNELLLAVYNALRMAHDLKLQSISIPAISSGIFGFPKDRCATIMFHAALQFFKNFPDTTVKLVRYTNFDRETVDIFEKEFESRFGKVKQAKEGELKKDETKTEQETKEDTKEEKKDEQPEKKDETKLEEKTEEQSTMDSTPKAD